MYRGLGIAVAALVLAISTAAHAADYWIVTQAGSSIVYADAESLARSASGVRFWAMQVYAQPKADRSAYLMIYANIDCAQRTLSLLSTAGYDLNGGFLGQSSAAPEPQYIIPDTVGASLARFACEDSAAWTTDFFHLTMAQSAPEAVGFAIAFLKWNGDKQTPNSGPAATPTQAAPHKNIPRYFNPSGRSR